MLLACTVATAMACGPWSRPHYYLFSAYQRNQMGNTFTQRMSQYWLDYDPLVKKTPWHIGELSWVENQGFDESNNAIIVAARNKRDREMLDYLRLLTKYLKMSNDTKDSWDYPSKADIAQRNRDLKYINNRARSYGGTRLAGQYCLLVMRSHMLMGEHDANIKYWNTHKGKVRASVYKDMMRDIYAGALLNTGQLTQAAQIYYELGDMASLRWIMRDNINLDGLKQEYGRDPNSPTLVYLVQELTNVLSDTHYSIMRYNTSGKQENRQEIERLIAFEQQVLAEGKTRCPALWQSSMGWLNHTMGNSREGIDQLNKAMQMNGTQRMIDNARACRLVATAESEMPSTKHSAWLEQEMQWVVEKEKTEEADVNYYAESKQNHYTEVLQNIVYDSMAPRYIESGHANEGIALLQWMDHHTDDNAEAKQALDKLTAQEFAALRTYQLEAPKSEWEAWLRQDIEPMSNDQYNDMQGTKLIREGQFAQAKPFLSRVSHKYLSDQAIAPYAAARSYRVKQCFARQTNAMFGTKITLTTNQKVDFVNDMLELQRQYDVLTDYRRAQVAYEIANMYFQASYKGNCWYLSRYGNSINDTVCYKNECDFLAEAARWYQRALAVPGVNLKAKQEYLYAAAYLPYGEPWAYYEFDQNLKLYKVCNYNTYQYRMLKQLSQFANDYPLVVAPYVTQCDVLQEFRVSQ